MYLNAIHIFIYFFSLSLFVKTDIKYDNNYAIPACIAEDPDDFEKDADSFEDILLGKEGWLTGWGHNSK